MRNRYFLIIFICSQLMSCSRHTSSKVQGYIEGDYIYLSSNVSGIIKEMFVDKGMKVKQGDKLLILENQPESDIYTAAQQNLTQAIAEKAAITASYELNQLTYERNKILVAKKAVEQAQLDTAKTAFQNSQAKLSEAEANIAQQKANVAKAKWALEQKTITAPANGMIFDRYYLKGENLPANQAALSLLTPENIKAIFFINEIQLGKIHINDKVTITCDGCSQSYHAKINYISPSVEYTPPVIYSRDTNDKLIYRIEAKFDANKALQLHPGQPINVTIIYD